MEGPSIKHTLRDPENNMTYHVMAYRDMSREEVVAAVRYYNGQPRNRRRKRPERDKIITIITLFGASPGT